MKHSARPQEPFTSRPASTAGSAQAEQTGRHLALELADEQPHKVRGYNPYDTVAHARDTRRRMDVWQHKPKRA